MRVASLRPLYDLSVATTPLYLLHVDLISIETTMLELNQSPRVANNVLVFQDHFTKHMYWNM